MIASSSDWGLVVILRLLFGAAEEVGLLGAAVVLELFVGLVVLTDCTVGFRVG